MENIQKNELCKKLDCNHIFHSGCINSWLKRNLECPDYVEMLLLRKQN